MRAALAGIALAAILAGCGSTRVVTVTVARKPAPPAGKYGVCVVFQRGTAEAVNVRGVGAYAVCNAIVRKWSNAGAFWTLYGLTRNDVVQSCQVKKSGVTLTVWDIDGGSQGQSTCGELAGSGWAVVG